MTSKQTQPNLFMNFTLGGLATSGACLFTNPIEVIKTRMQVEGELQAKGLAKKQYTGVGNALYVIFQREGIRGVQRGLVPACLYQCMMNGFRLGLYEPIRGVMGGDSIAPGSALDFVRNMSAGATSGALGALAGSPFFMIKCRIQIQSSSAALQVGYQHRYQGFLGAMREVVREEGARGLFRGATAAVPRVAVGSASQLSVYYYVKNLVVSTGFFEPGRSSTHFLSSFLTGFVVVLFMNPFDVVSTRMYNQPLGKDGKPSLYRGLGHCFYKIASTEGFAGFYKGWWPHFLRLGPHTILTFVFWEKLKILADVI
eukprot:TRINITY_DN8269_c0_g1::TRINITY_DN8269_c0_g1_i1::g.10219::m.10219 TRINITY_DN8269_c0_g1::TRINITY_DN8269_c0_g1_i1::g.10219  ORF type:complete len:313 (+),score=64.21,sp/A3KPP4/S2535_DANRE/43.43/8e-81,Mito_carr/PF00153.22/9.9e-18,Mito_carr/PF00153.22/3.2e-18,Mito_carr/PF00153.22/1.7e-17 TRINITY_DN8269_c0_g1_i1:89-1027(+)